MQITEEKAVFASEASKSPHYFVWQTKKFVLQEKHIKYNIFQKKFICLNVANPSKNLPHFKKTFLKKSI